MIEVKIFFKKEERGLLNPFITEFPDSSEIQCSEELVGGNEILEFIATITPAMLGALSGIIVALLKSRKLHFKYKNPNTNIEIELDLVDFGKKESLSAINRIIQSTNDDTCKNLLSEVVNAANNDVADTSNT